MDYSIAKESKRQRLELELTTDTSLFEYTRTLSFLEDAPVVGVLALGASVVAGGGADTAAGGAAAALVAVKAAAKVVGSGDDVICEVCFML